MLRSYNGTQPYIFISYAHRNRDQVLPLISEMQALGYRVWFDEGIDPGTEWDENIASHVECCGYFIALISQAYLDSENCKDELNYARELEKPRLLIYLENVQLPGGMKMRLGRLQAIQKYTYETDEAFFQKLEQTNGIAAFCDLEGLAAGTPFSSSAAASSRSAQSQYPSEQVLDFTSASEYSPEDRREFASQALEIYRVQYADEINAGTLTVRNLIYPPQWIQPKGSDSFMLLKDVPVDISSAKWDAPPPHSSYLPYARHGYAANRKNLSRGAFIFNGPMFALENFSGSVGDHDLAMTVKNGNYFDFLDTCEFLSYEMSYVRKVLRKKFPLSLTSACELPQRACQKELRDLNNRFAAIGINNATIFHNVEVTDQQNKVTKESFLLLQYRAGRDSDQDGTFGVIPAASYQPTGTDLYSAFNRDMGNTIYRELCEEVLDIDVSFHDDPAPKEELRHLPIFLLGFGFEPVTTKIEVMSAMEIDMDEPKNRDLFRGSRTSDELKRLFNTIFGDKLVMVPFNEHSLRQYYEEPRMTPTTKEILAIILEHMDFFRI